MPNDDFLTTPTDLVAGCFQFMTNWRVAVGGSLLQAQRSQWEMVAAWQRSIVAVQRELMDQWICRFGGGVPLDG